MAKLRHRARAMKKIIDNHPELMDALNEGFQHNRWPDSLRAQAPVVCAYTLIHWALDGKNQGQGYGFPFDRPYVEFAKRLYALRENLEQFKNISLQGQWLDNRPFWKMLGDLRDVVSDSGLRKAVADIQPKIQVFEKLRHAMRIAPKDGKQGLNANGMDMNMKTIEKRVTDFHHWLSTDRIFAQNKEYKKMIAQIDKYWVKLFADPITVQTCTGTGTIQPQRTNNILEHFFRDHKRAHRRRTGNGSMAKTFQTMLADTPLVKNLENPQYMETLLAGNPALEELFASIDSKLVRFELHKAQETPDKLPTKIRKIIANPMLPELVKNLFYNTTKCASES
ncbi:MAG: hypothetical protein JRJ60_12870 [Deltaproteobacteria bacterium]|nr:hypothetical protein [Deltaproteobacteria bacterium]